MPSPQGSQTSSGGQGAMRVDVRKQRTIVTDVLKSYFEEKGIEEGSIIMDDKLAPGTIGTPLEVTTNCWGIKVPQQFPVFQYDVTIQGFYPGKKKGVFLTKKTEDSPLLVENKDACRVAFELVVEFYDKVFTDKDGVFYDLQSLLYTTYELKPPAGTNMMVDGALVCVLLRSDIANVELVQMFEEVRLMFKRVVREVEVIAGDKSQAFNKDTSTYDRQPCNFLEIGISQTPYFNKEEFITFPNGKFYLKRPENYVDRELFEKCANFSKNKYIAPGFKKGIRFVSGKNNQTFFGMFVYPFKTAFFKNKSVADYLFDNNFDQDQRVVGAANRVLKGLTIYNGLAPRSRIKFDHISKQNAMQSSFLYNGENVTVAEYFSIVYNYELKYPHYPLVSGKNGAKKQVNFPAEIAIIADNQSVQKNQFEQREDANAIKICAQPPAQLCDEIKRLTSALDVGHNQKLQKMGITITPMPLPLTARVLPLPELKFEGSAKLTPAKDGGDWAKKGYKYFKQGKIGKWAVVSVAAVDCSSTRENYATMLVEGAKSQGIQMPDHPVFSEHYKEEFAILEAFKRGKELGVEFIFFVTDERVKNQGYMKQQERLYEIGTQNVKLTIAKDVSTRRVAATLENILHKTNMKFGGLNYNIDLMASPHIKNAFGTHPLIVGVSMSHLGSVDTVQQARGGAAREDKLSGGGYSANTGKNSLVDFVGDHFPIKAYRNEIIDSISGAVQRSATEFQTNQGVIPTSAVLYLTGSSEGDCQMLLKYSLPLLEIALETSCGGKKIPLTVIVPHRQHLAKIFRKTINTSASVKAQNLPPGTLVDQCLTHPTTNEFYMQSHMALQGTARPPKYVILRNTNKLADMNGITDLTHQLCFGYQISNSPCALPAPCVIAADYAERGAKMYKEIRETNIDVLHEKYGYHTSTRFKGHRINA